MGIFSIGKVSRLTGVSTQAIRFYERIGLLPEVPRTASGYREFSEETVRRLTFIHRAKEMGLTLKEIRGFLALIDGEAADCGDILAFTQKKIAEIDRKIADLQRLKSFLVLGAHRCPGKGPLAECPIIDGFMSGEAMPSPAALNSGSGDG